MNAYGHRILKTKYYIVDLDTKTFDITQPYTRMCRALDAIPPKMRATAIKGSELLEYPNVWYAAIPTPCKAKAS